LLASTYIGALDDDLVGEVSWAEPLFKAFVAGAWLTHWTEDALYWVSKPRVKVFPSNRPSDLNNPAGPVLESHVENLYFLDDVLVPEVVVRSPERVTHEDITLETHAEVRRKMLERYGWPRYIQNCEADIVDTVPMDYQVVGLRGARLLRKELAGEPEPIVYLEMRNSTPEHDGHYKRYLERIDPKAYDGDAGRLCHAAMASRWYHRDDNGRLVRTFERWQDYAPTEES
jgi:hypothetical protein